ncbi:MAG: alpha/beta fold hydrolase [Ferruginibacter sp.]
MKSLGRIILKFLLFLFISLNFIVAFHAYKFTHFYEPGDVSKMDPAKASTWQKTQAILFGFNAVKQKNSTPDTVVQIITLATSDNLKLEAWYIPVINSKGTVALFHGHGSKKSAILAEAHVFRSLGYNTMLTDFRAHGGSEGSTCTIGYEEARDVKAAYDFLAARQEKNIILYGISLGAATITKAIYDYGITPSHIILDMPFASLPDAVRGRVKMMKLPQEPISTLLTLWGGLENGFWAFNMKPYQYARDVKCPVLLQRGSLDSRVTAEETNEIYANILAPKKLVTYANSGHESLCKKEPVKWQQEVALFLP